MFTIKVLMIAHEDIFDGVGGLGVHIQAVAKILKNKVDLTILCNSYSLRGLYYCNEEGQTQTDINNWEFREGYYRIVIIRNNNDINSNNPLLQTTIIDRNALSSVLVTLGQEQFNIIHIHDSTLWFTAQCLRDLWKCPIVFSMHLSFLLNEYFPNGEYFKLLLQREGSAMMGADTIITVSNYYKQELKQYYLREDIEVISNGIDYNYLSKIETKMIPGKIGFVGRCVSTKGINELMKVAQKLKHKQFVFLSAKAENSTDNSIWIKRLEKLTKKKTNITWLPNHLQKDKWKQMKSCEFGIVPSLHEPFGIVALEWLALGVPLIVSNVGGLKEFCNKDNAILYNPQKDNLIDIIKNAKYSKDKVENGRKTAQNYSWNNCSELTI